MSIGKDYTKLVEDATEKLTYTQNEWFLPQHPFRLLNVGPSGSGKSNVLLGLLFGMEKNGKWVPPINYDKVYYYLQDTGENKFEFIQKEFKKIERKLKREQNVKTEIMVYSQDPEDIVDWRHLNKDLMNLVIFDDMITESPKIQKKIRDLFILGRKQNASVIYLTQGLTEVPRLIRKNTTCMLIFEPDVSDEIPLYLRWYAGTIGKQALAELFEEAFSEPYGFVFIDVGSKKSTPVHMRYRVGFDGINHNLKRIGVKH